MSVDKPLSDPFPSLAVPSRDRMADSYFLPSDAANHLVRNQATPKMLYLDTKG
jgi:hypothetical protein